jgi:ligand-binding sensor domain-containing protein
VIISRYSILAICLYYVFTAQTQTVVNYRFINYSHRDGLPEKYVYSATQDHKGFMWFGTGGGLYKFDGHKFHFCKSPINKSGRTIANILQAVYTDETGNLWLGSLNDLQWYNPRENRFWSPLESDSMVQKLKNAYILNFYMDSRKQMWISTSYDYFYRFNPEDSTFSHYNKVYDTESSQMTLKIIESRDGRYFSIHSEGVYEFSLQGEKIHFYSYPGNQISNAYYSNSSNEIYLTTYEKGILLFNPNTGSYSEKSFRENAFVSNHLFCLTKSADEQLWVGSYPLISAYSSGQLIHIFEQDHSSEFNFQTTKIGNLFYDRQQNLWICSHNGLSMMPWQNQQIKRIELRNPVNNKEIEGLGLLKLDESGELLMPNSNTQGLFIFNLNTLERRIISNPVSEKYKLKPINSIFESKKGVIYASDGDYLFRYIASEKRLIPIISEDKIANFASSPRKIIDNFEHVYFPANDVGCYVLNLENGKLHLFRKSEIDSSFNIHKDNTLIPCLNDSKGFVWFTSETGLYRYNPLKNSWSVFQTSSEMPGLNSAFYMEEDNYGHYWISSINNGLFELYFENSIPIFKNYNQESKIGLPVDYLLKIKKEPATDKLWIASSAGLIRFDPINKKVITFLNKQTGLSESDAHYGFTITPDGFLYSLQYGLMDVIDLNAFKYNDYNPPVEFSSIKVQDKEMRFALDFSKNEILHLKYTENFISFEFTALNFTNTNRTQYAYQLEGVDKNWVNLGNRNYISFSNLQYGTYRFKVKAENSDGKESSEITSIIFIIHPPFWKTWWFNTLLFLLAAGVFYVLIKYRIHSVTHEERQSQEFQRRIMDLEMKALRAQMNPHFIFNSLNSIQKYILKKDHLLASQYLTKFARLMRLILDHSDQNYVTIQSEIELLSLYIEMESLRFDNVFTYEFQIDPLLQVDTDEIPTMIIQPYVENAIWHGLLHKPDSGHMKINFEKDGVQMLKISIEDNGIGREKANELKSKQILKKKSYGNY